MPAKKTKGFTLVEIMVALSIFAIVSFVATGTLISISNSYRKSQNVKLLIDNLSFALDSMSFKIREGRIVSVSPTQIQVNYPEGHDIYYVFDHGVIDQCVGTITNCTPITSSEVTITKVLFSDDPMASRLAVTITVEASTGNGGKTSSSIIIQTTAATRSSS